MTSTRPSLAAAAAALVLSLAPLVLAQDAPRTYDAPLGSAMEEWPYPFPVRFLPLTVDGQPVRLAYMDVAPTGAANGSAVLLLHGKNFYGSYWERPARALAAAGYRVVIPDQLGFGKSSKPDVHYSFDLLAANTAALLDSLGIAKVAVVGHSMGGMLAVRFARNYPERTTRLALENPIGLEDYRFFVPPQTTERVAEDELKQTDPAKIRAFLKNYFVEWRPEYEPFVEVRARIALGGEFPRWARSSALTYQMIVQQPVRHEFSLLRVPTLLVIGQDDRTVVGRQYLSDDERNAHGNYPELGRAAAKDIPGAKLVEVSRCGHIPHLEQPKAFEETLLRFLGNHL